jgi:acyl-CoA reductase-like NAD-dependent aldehyde dehydrogenase
VTTTREPFGPVLSIPAFNFPMTLALRSIGTCPFLSIFPSYAFSLILGRVGTDELVDPLACGNTVIFKSESLAFRV